MSEELTWMPAWQIRDLIAKREVSAVEVLEHFLGRIEEHNGVLKAFKTVDEKGARAQAEAADRAVAAGEELGPLHGIPISFKEHIAIKGLPMMSLGALSGGGDAQRDSLPVERIRAAGAVIVGSNTMMGTEAKMGEAMAAGPWVYPEFNWEAEARNPWNSDYAPGWSSSGGASAAAAALLPITIGSDGGGSTRLPAAYSGVVGIHGTAALVPSVDYDIYRLPGLIGSCGPLARNVVDAAMTHHVMAGPDGRDFTSIPIEPDDYLASIEGGVDGMRMAWTSDFGFTDMYAMEESPRVIAAVREAAMGFNTIGATVEDTNAVWKDFFAGNTTTKHLFGMNPKVPTPEEWADALDTRKYDIDTTREVLRDHDVILSVTSQLLARPVLEWDSCWREPEDKNFIHGTFAPVYCSHTMMFNWIGFPAFAIPCGFVDGMPISLQIIGKPCSEATMYRVARAFQEAFPRDEHPAVS
jgi:aspartyl-tRNA(Asn)/glutamyl-tRNA(Gln) amidotransferase subunit A